MKTCYGYVRVSTQKQGEGVSLEAQRDAIFTFAAKSSITITHWFEEKETAAKSGRPIFLAMMKLLMKRKADGVVLHKVDRGARNLADWAKFAELADAGIDVHFANENLDFRSRGGRLTADIQAVIAADYIRNLREECIKGIDGRLKQGLYPFGAPMGYLNNGGGKPKTIDPINGPLVKRAFELYASGEYSLRSLPKELARIGLFSPNGKVISKNGLERILRNPFYCGLMKLTRGNAIYQGVHEPLITANLFSATQTMRAGRTTKKATKLRHTYRGLFKCQLCGFSMVPEAQKGHIYYRCQTKTCETKTVREEVLEVAIKDTLSRVRLSDESIAFLVNEIEEWMHTRAEDASANTYQMQLTQIEEKLVRLTDALVDRLIDSETFAARKQSLFLEKARVNEAVNTIKKLPDRTLVQKFLELIKSLSMLYENANADEKRQLVQITTSNRSVCIKNVLVEPAKWLLQTEEAIAVLQCGLDRHTSRNSHDVQTEQVEKLFACLEDKSVGEILNEEQQREEV